ncbi:prepilin-type N-terminal cleavage/methylation domain-containing protein [Patescibacteria group bacterium]|nr:prepilin-type N-terminal cleavage/methylation domain-containing protein [Patescibacteria group bacterium]
MQISFLSFLMQKKAFTLIELVIGIVLIGV